VGSNGVLAVANHLAHFGAFNSTLFKYDSGRIALWILLEKTKENVEVDFPNTKRALPLL